MSLFYYANMPLPAMTSRLDSSAILPPTNGVAVQLARPANPACTTVQWVPAFYSSTQLQYMPCNAIGVRLPPRVNRSVKCTECGITLNSAHQARQHYKGKSHQRRLQKLLQQQHGKNTQNDDVTDQKAQQPMTSPSDDSSSTIENHDDDSSTDVSRKRSPENDDTRPSKYHRNDVTETTPRDHSDVINIGDRTRCKSTDSDVIEHAETDDVICSSTVSSVVANDNQLQLPCQRRDSVLGPLTAVSQSPPGQSDMWRVTAPSSSNTLAVPYGINTTSCRPQLSHFLSPRAQSVHYENPLKYFYIRPPCLSQSVDMTSSLCRLPFNGLTQSNDVTSANCRGLGGTLLCGPGLSVRSVVGLSVTNLSPQSQQTFIRDVTIAQTSTNQNSYIKLADNVGSQSPSCKILNEADWTTNGQSEVTPASQLSASLNALDPVSKAVYENILGKLSAPKCRNNRRRNHYLTH